DEVDVDLRIASVAAARGQAHGAAPVPVNAQLVARERTVAGVLVGGGAATLHDEVRCDTVEREAVVVTRLGESREACSVRGREPRLQPQHDLLAALDRKSTRL